MMEMVSAARASVPTEERVIEADGVSVRFPVGRSGFWGQQVKWVHAVDDVSFTVHHGETLGLVGESGSGKTTIGRRCSGASPPATAGSCSAQDITTHPRRGATPPAPAHAVGVPGSLRATQPRMSVLQLVAEPLVVHGRARSAAAARDQVVALLERCGLPEDTADRHPHAFSGGNASASGSPGPWPCSQTSSSPTSRSRPSTPVRAQIVNLLQDLQRELGIAYLFIAHDLSVVRHISHRIAILYAGKLVELADSDAVYETPRHPTRRRCCPACQPDPPLQRAQRIVLQGEIPNPIDPPPGCRFQTRCPLVQDVCRRPCSRRRRQVTGPLASCADTSTMTQLNTDPRRHGAPSGSHRTDRRRRSVRRLLAGLFVGGGSSSSPASCSPRMTQRLAHGTSLAAVVPISAASLVSYAAHGNVDWNVATWLAVGAVGGGHRTRLLHVLPQRTSPSSSSSCSSGRRCACSSPPTPTGGAG